MAETDLPTGNGQDARALDLWEVQAELRGAQLMLEAAQRNRQEAQRMLLEVCSRAQNKSTGPVATRAWTSRRR